MGASRELPYFFPSLVYFIYFAFFNLRVTSLALLLYSKIINGLKWII